MTSPVMHAGYNPFGVNTFMEQEVEPVKRERICQMLHDAGVGWIRQEFPWEDIEIHGKGDFEDRRHETVSVRLGEVRSDRRACWEIRPENHCTAKQSSLLVEVRR